MRTFFACLMMSLTLYAPPCSSKAAMPEKIRDHTVILDAAGRLQPWTSYDNLIHWSMNFIFHCPTRPTKFGHDPWYLITSKFNSDGTFQEKNTKQNNQGSNLYWAMETAKRYYAYSGDQRAFEPVRRLLQRILYYLTPADWAWPRVPRTQDNTPDGEYTDEYGEPDKMAMVALAALDYYHYSHEKRYLSAAKKIAETLAQYVRLGDAEHSPLPFRVHLRTGEVLDEYSANAIVFVRLFESLAPHLDHKQRNRYAVLRQQMWQWLERYPLSNQRWSGYYEDVVSHPDNYNQQIPMETARYILQNPNRKAADLSHVPALLDWVEKRFGQTRHFGAISIREQDSCFVEMSSHTARFASIAAMWYGASGDSAYYEKARAAFALATYSAYNHYSVGNRAINYVGIGYAAPWFSDSYWDYIPHFFDGMADMPEMLPQEQNHLFYSSDLVRHISYSPTQIEYQTYSPIGEERLKVTFTPQVFTAGKPLDPSCWSFGPFHGVENILRIHRNGIRHILIRPRPAQKE